MASITLRIRLSSPRILLLAMFVFVLQGCGGGGGGGPAPTYTVGVTVSGLVGSGLVLQNNNGDNLSVSADGSFIFATEIVDGGSYAVSILSQASEKTCLVTNGNGTINSTNVNYVLVSCRDRFNKARGFNGTVNTVALATDGSGDLYVGGEFTAFNSTVVNYLARFNSDGTLDTAFDMSGGGPNRRVTTIAPATDDSGDLYVGGDFSSINGSAVRGLARLNSDGSVDTVFDMSSGGVNPGVFALAATTDGSGDLYVGGDFTRINGTVANRVARLNSDGTLDAAFDMSGGGANREVRTLVPATDASGDLYVGGDFTRINGAVANHVARLNSDGTLDIAFDMSSGGANNDVLTLAAATDGSGDLYVGGHFTRINGTVANRVARLNSDGTLDTAFDMSSGGVNGRVHTLALATDSSGDLYVGGGSFSAINGTSVRNLARLNSDGSVDTAFDMSGGGIINSVLTLAPATDDSGDLYVGGRFTNINGSLINRLGRLNSDGSVDSAFDMSSGGVDEDLHILAPATDGSGDLYVGGGFNNINGTAVNGLARLNSDGTLDTAFDMSNGGVNRDVFALAPTTDGSGDLYIGGWFSIINGAAVRGLARLNSDGTLDAVFDMSGGGARGGDVLTLALATDGSGDLYVGGDFRTINGTAVNRLARLNSDGTLDTAFDMSGGGVDDRVQAFVLATDGSGDLYVGGDFTTINGQAVNRLARLNSDGTLDTAFDMSGGGASSRVNTLASATDGSGDLYVGGGFTIINGTLVNHLARLNSDGTLDTVFDMSGGGAAHGTVYILAPAMDGSGDLYVGGLFTAINGTAVNGLARLNSDGSVDAAFDMNSGGANSEVETLAPATDGSGDLFVGGGLASINNITTGPLARLHSDGEVD